ncbi:hypothetical protein BKA69DRAFT_1101086 [Paraphysoderma sedebokerense]|nr:hypothetical protein BKA69DRAFT_1101086 [Paraphysoderma sedebokerense]
MSNLACRQKVSTKYFAAISDLSPVFNGPPCRENQYGGTPDCPNQASCRQCFQIRCVSKFMWYDQGNKNDKSSCISPEKSVVVQVADACPSMHKINRGKGNQNPCGETSRSLNHFDLNLDAFQEIATTGDGIIHMEFKQVDCAVGLGVN